MQPTAQPAPHTAHRPTWLLWLIAMPVGVLANALTGGLENLPQALMTLMGWLHEPSQIQRYSAKMISRMLLPGLLAFLVLRVTPLGRWLAPNRLAVAGLILANGLLTFVVLYGLYQASMGELPYLMGLAEDIVHLAVTVAFVVGLGSLAVLTVWHRLVRDNERALRLG